MNEHSKGKSKKVLASLVMGINAVNVFAPMVQAVDKMADYEGQVLNNPPKEIALDKKISDETAGYDTLDTVAGYVNNLVFQKAYAWTSNVTSGNTSVGTMVYGDVMNITNAAVAVGTMYGGYQYASSGGVGTVGTMSGGRQHVSSGGVGAVGTINGSGGEQLVYGGGVGTVVAMNDGEQVVYSGGVGTVVAMNYGAQAIEAGGVGTVVTMSSGVQGIETGAVGIVETMENGGQWVLGTGTVGTMNDGEQLVYSGAVGTVETMSGGAQVIDAGGVGTVVTMSSGVQNVYSGAVGTVETMNGGEQNITGGAVGTVVTMNSGEQYVQMGGTGTVEVMNDGVQYITSGATGTVETMNGGEQYVYSGAVPKITNFLGGSQIIYIANAIVSGQVVNGGTQIMKEAGTFDGTILNSGMLAYETAAGIVKDLTMNGGTVVFGADSDTYSLSDSFTANGGTVDMTKRRDGIPVKSYEVLNIDSLNGSGVTFLVDTDLAGETNSDKINIISSTPGTRYIQVLDSSLASGSTVIGMRSLLIATDDSGNSIFEGKALDTGGLWDLTPVIESDDGVNWYLRKIEKKENPSTEALTANISSTYALWRSALTDDNLRLRLGDLRLTEEKTGVWARVKANSMSGDGYDAKSQVFQVGYDKAVGKNVFGVAVDQTNTSSDLTNGKSDGSMTGISLYMTNYKDNGMYSDIVLRGGKLRNDMDSYGEYPDKLDIDTFGYSASYEIGKTIEQGNGWFIEPQGQLVYGHLNGGEYTTNRGVVVDRNGVNSLIARLGFVVGQRNETSDYYLKANFYREFLGKDKMDLRAANGETMDYASENKGNWFELGLGGNVKLAKETYFYGDVSKSFGGDIKKKWQVNAGVRFTW